MGFLTAVLRSHWGRCIAERQLECGRHGWRSLACSCCGPVLMEAQSRVAVRRLDWSDVLVTGGVILLVIGLWTMAPPWAMVLMGGVSIVGGLLLGTAISSRK